LRLPALRHVVAMHSADIWVLTETHDDLSPPDWLYAKHSAQRQDSGSGIRSDSRWVSIWSRYRIIKDVSLPEADRDRTIAVLLDVGRGRTMLVYGTVMPWRNDPKFGKSDRHEVILKQSAEWHKLRCAYPDADLCIAGDFNQDMGTGAFYGDKEGIAALRSGLAECKAFCATEHVRLQSGLDSYPLIDHIALPIAKQESASVVAVWAADKKTLSDHSGVIVEVAD
jgi:hypothetical protein